MDGLRKFIAVDNYEAVKAGDLYRETRFKKVVKPRFTTDFPGADFWEGADELTLRAYEEGVLRTFTDTANVGNRNGRHRRPFFRESKDQSGRPCVIDTMN